MAKILVTRYLKRHVPLFGSPDVDSIELCGIKKEFVQLELEQKRLELEQKKLELQKQRLDLHARRIDHALDTADRLVHMLPPEADAGTKATLLQTLLPGLLPPGESHTLESALSALTSNAENESTRNDSTISIQL